MLASAYRPPTRASTSLWLLAAVLGLLAIFLSPETLIALGPMRMSLTADNELTRETALATVGLARGALALGAISIALLIASWQPVANSRWVAALCRYSPVPEASDDGPILNGSFRISVAAFTAVLLYVATAPILLSDTWRAAIAREDGVLEQASALLFLASSSLSLIVAWKLFGERRPSDPSAPRRVAWHVLIGLFFFLCFGEEISWGQRIFGFEAPEQWREINVQEETNLHNMMGYLADHVFILGMFVYGAVLPLLAKRYDFWRRSLYWVGLPLASLGLAVGFALASGIHEWTLYAVLPREAGVRAAELREVLTALCCGLLTVECLQRLPRARVPRDEARLAR
jgi:hypothetical protein